MNEIDISLLQNCSATQYEQLAYLTKVLSQHNHLTPQKIEDVLESSSSYMAIAQHGKQIVGMGTLCIFHSPTGAKASIEDVVVLPQEQSQGIGRRIVEFLLQIARQSAPITIQLTSRPSRAAANALYQSMGFQSKETNFYTLKVDIV